MTNNALQAVDADQVSGRQADERDPEELLAPVEVRIDAAQFLDRMMDRVQPPEPAVLRPVQPIAEEVVENHAEQGGDDVHGPVGPRTAQQNGQRNDEQRPRLEPLAERIVNGDRNRRTDAGEEPEFDRPHLACD